MMGSICLIFCVFAFPVKSAPQCTIHNDGMEVCTSDVAFYPGQEGELADDESAFIQTQQGIRKHQSTTEEPPMPVPVPVPARIRTKDSHPMDENIALVVAAERAKWKQLADTLDVRLVASSESMSQLDAKTGVKANLTSMTWQSPTAAEKEEFLSVTNKYRCYHGASPVVWSDVVESELDTYISPLTNMVHDPTIYSTGDPGKPCGENLFWSSAPMSPTQAIDAWYSEVNNCNPNPTSFTDGCQSGNGVTGHFTVLVWSSVQSIGCAFSSNRQLIGCRYKAGDSLDYDTPNMMPASNYASHVNTRISDYESACPEGGSSAGSAPAPPPTTTPAPAGGGCMSNSGCTFTNSCSNSVSFNFECQGRGTFRLNGFPGNFQYNLGVFGCSSCGSATNES